MFRFSLFGLGVIFAYVGPCLAQESRATIIGRAIDPTGALVSGATVQATNTATNATAKSVTTRTTGVLRAG